MSITLTKPVVGSSGWGSAMNENLDSIETAVNANATAVSEHTGAGETKHTSEQISHGDTTAKAKIDATASLVEAHTDNTASGQKHKAKHIFTEDGVSIENKIAQIMQLLTINAQNVTISARVREIPGYISISASISPATVSPRFWRAIVSKREGTGTTKTVVEVLTQDFYASRTKIPFDILPGVDVGDILYIKVFAFFSESDFAEANELSLTYQGYESPIVVRVRNLEENINIPAFVAAAKEDPALITSLVNELQNSITLARNISKASAQ